jgi:hypothetical protein
MHIVGADPCGVDFRRYEQDRLFSQLQFDAYENLRKLRTEQRTDSTPTAIIGRQMELTRSTSAKRISAL